MKFYTAILILITSSSAFAGIEPQVDTDCSGLINAGIETHGTKRSFYEDEFNHLKNDPNHEMTEALRCLSAARYPWAQALVSVWYTAHTKKLRLWANGGEGGIQNQMWQQIKAGGQTERLIYALGYFHKISFVGVDRTRPYLDRDLWRDWMQSGPFNYLLAARLSHNHLRNSMAVDNVYGEVYVYLDKLASEGFIDAWLYYGQLKGKLSNSEKKHASKRLSLYKKCYPEEAWSNKVFLPHLCK